MRTAPSDTLTAAGGDTGDVIVDGTVLVEARTAQEALEQVSERLGADAEIVNAERVLRGGVAGFFAREHVVLTARPRRSTAAAAAGPAVAVDRADPDAHEADDAVESPGAVARPGRTDGATVAEGLDAILARLAEDTDAAELSFSEALRRELGDTMPARPDGSVVTTTDAVAVAPPRPAPPVSAAPVSGPPHPAPPVSGPTPHVWPSLSPAAPAAPAPSAAPTDHDPSGVAWSALNLRRLGLPASVTDAVVAQAPHDDVTWLAALSRVLAPLCGALPEGPALLVGPRALRLARPLGLPGVRARADLVPPGSACLRTTDSPAGRAWIARERGDRALHLVVGGSGWERLLFDEPCAVSWAGDEHVARAVALAAELGVVLGYAVDARGQRARRAAPVDLAFALRVQLPRS